MLLICKLKGKNKSWWEVVKLKEVDLYDVIHTTNYKQYKSENVDLLKQYFLTQQEYEIIKKAMENQQ